MNWLSLQSIVQALAQTSVERLLNALPEGILIVFFVWALLRVLRRQNSGTRFAVWFLALLTVAALPVMDGLAAARSLLVAGAPWVMPSATLRPAITIPGSWALVLFLVWAVGAGVAMLRLAFGLWRLRKLRRSCTPVVLADLDPAMRKTVAGILETSSVTIATSDSVRIPAAIGFWKQTIVLPAWTLRELPPEDLNVILLHEFAHLRRGDGWTNLIQKMVRALFFFHPAVWWIETRLSVEREMACDDAVLAETANPRGYATCLVSLLEKSMKHRLATPRWTMAQAAVHRAHEAALRLARILDKNRPAATRVWKPAVGMVSAFSLVCLVALSHAPQFVAFDHALPANDSGHAYLAAVNQSGLQSSSSLSLPTPQVIPAALRTSALLPVKAPVKIVRERAAGREPVSVPVVAAQMREASPRDRVVEVSANADQEMAPQFQTLVFIQATQYVTSDSSVWSVQVWRVTLFGPALTPAQKRWLSVPLAHSI
jgi:beta-lactamase regulating signal transducer with metallopeptidase domain